MTRRGFLGNLAVIAILTAVYFAAAKLGLALAHVHPSATAVWPPTGIAFAALLLMGYQVWPGIFLGAFLANITTAGSVATCIGIATGHTLEAVVGVYLVTRFAHGRHVFDRLPDIFKFISLAAMLSPAVSATVGVTSLSLGGYADWSSYGPIWVTWWLGNAGGMLIVAPLLVLWSVPSRTRWDRMKMIEGGLFVVILLLITQCIFLEIPAFVQYRRFALPFLLIPLLMWVAFRLGPRETATSTFLISAIAIFGTVGGFYPFVRATPHEGMLVLQIFLSTLAVMGLALAATVSEQDRMQEDLRLIINSVPALISYVDVDHRYRFVNASYEEWFGASRGWIKGRHVREVLGDPVYQAVRSRIEAALSGRQVRFENEVRRVDGEVRTVDVSFVPHFGPDGRATGLYVIASDITERKWVEAALHKAHDELEQQVQTRTAELVKASEALRESEERYRIIAETATDAIMTIDAESTIIFVNPAVERIFGYTRAELLGQRLTLLMPETLRRRYQAWMKSYLATGERHISWQGIELSGLHKTGREIPLEISFSEFSKDGRRLFTGFVRDITERKQAAQALRKSEERFRLMVEGIKDYAIFMLDAEGRVETWNTGAEEIKGYRAAEIIGKHFSCFYPPEERERGKPDRQLQTATTAGRVEDEGWRVRKDGTRFWANVIITAVTNKEGKLIGFTKITHDLTERKRAEETLAALYETNLKIQEPLELKERLSLIIRASETVLHLDRVNILLADQEGHWLEAVATFGTDEPLETIRVPIGPAGGGIVKAYLTQQMITWDGRDPVPEEFRLKPPYDQITALRSRVFANVPLVVEGKSIGVLGADRKHSRRPFDTVTLKLLQLFAAQAGLAIENARLYEEQLFHRERLRALTAGVLKIKEEEAKRIAHALHDEAGQLLASVHLALEEIAQEIPSSAHVPLQHIREQLIRVEDQLRRLSHELRPTILDDLGLQPAIHFLAQGVSARAGISTSVEGSIEGRLSWPVETAIYRIVQEALTNVIKHAEASSVRIQLRREAGVIRCAVRDDGIGFYVPAVFNRREKRGLGFLGIRERVDSLGGKLSVISAPGQGTEVLITIPINEEQPEDPQGKWKGKRSLEVLDASTTSP